MQKTTNTRGLSQPLIQTQTKKLLVLIFCFVLFLGPATLIGHVSATTPQAVIGMPFSGKWAYNALVNPPYTDTNSSHPCCHWTPGGGNWATDVYASEGTAVKLDVTYATGALSYSWGSSSTSCGQSTLVNIIVGGTTIGWLYFAHLNNAVTSGTITNGMTLGTVHDWGGCNPGVHVHVEFHNASNYACYADNGQPGSTLSYGTNLGVLGSSNTGAKQACSSIPSGGTATSSRPAVLTRSSDSMDVFYRNTSHQMITQGWTATNNWGTAAPIPSSSTNNVSSNPTAVSRTSDSIDLFYRDTSNNLENLGWTSANNWSGPWGLVTDGSVNGDPVVIAPDSNHMWVFYKDSTSRLMDKKWDNVNGWASPHIDISSSSVASSPSAVVLDANNFFVFYRNTSGNMDEIGYSSGAWSGPSTRANNVQSDFTAISRTSTSLDLFYKASGGGLGNVGYSSGSWSDYEWTVGNTIATSGNSFRGSPLVIKRDSNNMSVFYQDNQNNLIEKAWNATTSWAAPYNRATNIFDNPGGVSRTSDSIDTFFRDGNANLISQGWTATYGWVQGPTGAGSMD